MACTFSKSTNHYVLLLYSKVLFKHTLAPEDTKNFFLLEENTLRNQYLKIITDKVYINSYFLEAFK